MNGFRFTAIVLTVVFSMTSCHKNDPEGQNEEGSLVLNFEHFVNGAELVFDEMKYTNEAGNTFEVTEIQYFLSDITLNKSTGGQVLIDDERFAHYIDTNIPETMQWSVADQIPAGDYKSISLTFGIKGEKNKPFMFTDPPQSDMLWPMNLGGDQGGYHYMKLNGFWMNEDNEREPFNFHLGVGQERDADNNITGFIQNWIEVELPNSSFTVQDGASKNITIRMNVEEWWKNPNIYDHNLFGGKIMQNQEAMQLGAENARSVFEVSNITATTEQM
jgi:hypothetical protein